MFVTFFLIIYLIYVRLHAAVYLLMQMHAFICYSPDFKNQVTTDHWLSRTAFRVKQFSSAAQQFYLCFVFQTSFGLFIPSPAQRNHFYCQNDLFMSFVCQCLLKVFVKKNHASHASFPLSTTYWYGAGHSHLNPFSICWPTTPLPSCSSNRETIDSAHIEDPLHPPDKQ